MEIRTKAIIFNGIRSIEEFDIKVNDYNYRICIEKLKYEHRKIINLMKEYKSQGVINSLSKPRNKKIQSDLNNLIKASKEIKNSISKLKTAFQ